LVIPTSRGRPPVVTWRLARHEPEPGGQIACTSEDPAMADRRKQSRGVQRADPGNGDQAAGSLLGARSAPFRRPSLRFCDRARPIAPDVLDERHHP
jgi:hypothetical protein